MLGDDEDQGYTALSVGGHSDSGRATHQQVSPAKRTPIHHQQHPPWPRADPRGPHRHHLPDAAKRERECFEHSLIRTSFPPPFTKPCLTTADGPYAGELRRRYEHGGTSVITTAEQRFAGQLYLDFLPTVLHQRLVHRHHQTFSQAPCRLTRSILDPCTANGAACIVNVSKQLVGCTKDVIDLSGPRWRTLFT